MKIHIQLEIDTNEEKPRSMARLAALFGSENRSSVTESITYAVDGVSQTESRTVAETVDVELHTLVDNLQGPSPIAGDDVPASQVQEQPAKRTRGKAKGVHTPPPDNAGVASGPTDLGTALDTALEAMPGVTDLTAPVEDAQPTEAVVEAPKPVTTLEEEVAAVEETIDVLSDAEPSAPKVDERPPVEGMDLVTAGAEIRRLVILNTGAWLRDILNHYKVNRISDLSLDQAQDAIRNGRALEDKRAG